MLLKDGLFFLPITFIAVFTMLFNVDFAWTEGLPNYAVILDLIKLSITAL